MLIGTLTESLEDYLEIIFRLLLTQKVARVRDIAKAKNVKTSSVTSALQRLAKEGLVEYHAREYVDLTETGRELAFRLNQRHEFLKRFLIDLLQVDPETAEHDACSIEHAISVTTLDRFAAFSEFITYCPKVDKNLVSDFRDCWLNQDKDDHCERMSECGLWQRKMLLSRKLGVVSLADLKQGERGVIARIIAPEEERKLLIQDGLLPASSMKVVSRDEGEVVVDIQGRVKRLSREQAAAVYLWVDGASSISEDRGNGEKRLTMAELYPGDSFKVVKLIADGEIRQRLVDMGFVRGVKGRFVREALLRDPIEIDLDGYYLSLRRAEARNIIVEAIDE